MGLYKAMGLVSLALVSGVLEQQSVCLVQIGRAESTAWVSMAVVADAQKEKMGMD